MVESVAKRAKSQNESHGGQTQSSGSVASCDGNPSNLSKVSCIVPPRFWTRVNWLGPDRFGLYLSYLVFSNDHLVAGPDNGLPRREEPSTIAAISISSERSVIRKRATRLPSRLTNSDASARYSERFADIDHHETPVTVDGERRSPPLPLRATLRLCSSTFS